MKAEYPVSIDQGEHKSYHQNNQEQKCSRDGSGDQYYSKRNQGYKEDILQPDIPNFNRPIFLQTAESVMYSFKRFPDIFDSGQASAGKPFCRCRQRAHQAPESSAKRHQYRFQYEPPQDPHKYNCNVAIADRAAPQAAEYKQVNYNIFGSYRLIK